MPFVQDSGPVDTCKITRDMSDALSVLDQEKPMDYFISTLVLYTVYRDYASR